MLAFLTLKKITDEWWTKTSKKSTFQEVQDQIATFTGQGDQFCFMIFPAGHQWDQ